MKLTETVIDNVVIGSGAAGFACALRLQKYFDNDVAIITENVKAGTSRNTGSDKQTYYKLGMAGDDPDSVGSMAENLLRCFQENVDRRRELHCAYLLLWPLLCAHKAISPYKVSAV